MQCMKPCFTISYKTKCGTKATFVLNAVTFHNKTRQANGVNTTPLGRCMPAGNFGSRTFFWYRVWQPVARTSIVNSWGTFYSVHVCQCMHWIRDSDNDCLYCKSSNQDKNSTCRMLSKKTSTNVMSCIVFRTFAPCEKGPHSM